MEINKPKILRTILGIVFVIIALIAGYTWITLNWSYSKGDRAGFVQKFSKKGWLCKTWEGELQMMPVPGAVPERFLFSVRDDAIAQRINASLGKRVTLQYEQHKGVPTNCFAETEYFVTEVKSIE